MFVERKSCEGERLFLREFKRARLYFEHDSATMRLNLYSLELYNFIMNQNKKLGDFLNYSDC